MTRRFLTPLQLPTDPTQPMEAATKQYVDTTTASGSVTAALTFATTDWEQYPTFMTCQVTKVGTIVVCQGMVRRVTGAPTFTSGAVATIPAGYRPSGSNLFYTITFGGPCRLDVTAAGAINVNASPAVSLPVNGWVTLSMAWTTT